MNIGEVRYKTKEVIDQSSNFSLVFWTVLGLVLVAALIFGFPQVIGAEEALIVKSGSMEPVIPTGSVIWIYDADADDLSNGTIITFGPEEGNPDDQYTTHRIVEVRQSSGGKEYVTKGDANDDPDPGTVTSDRVVGVHGFTVPYLGYAVVEGRDSGVFLILIGVASVLLILGELRQIYREYRQMKEEGEGRDIVQTFAVAFSLLIVGIAALRFTSYPSKLMEIVGISVSTDILTGILIMAAMLFSIIFLRFL